MLTVPLEALDPELDVVDTPPVLPALPELPEVELGLAVALPLEVDPVEPVLPVTTTTLTLQVPE